MLNKKRIEKSQKFLTITTTSDHFIPFYIVSHLSFPLAFIYEMYEKNLENVLENVGHTNLNLTEVLNDLF